MTLIIVAILLLCYFLIVTESVTNINKAAAAIFCGTLGWVLYVCFGTHFVMSQHPMEYSDFLSEMAFTSTSSAVRNYIAHDIFLKYVGRASEIVLFLLATMTIVEVLSNNGCFDFLRQLLRTRRSGKMLWTLSGITFVLSANLDNLTSTVMMLTIMHEIIPNRRQRMLFGSAIVLAANCGGALTVIGDAAGLWLWNMGYVTATSYSMALALPCLTAWAVPTWYIGRQLPERVDTEWITMPYRGDDTRLNTWQRLLMLVVGIGGLWFIPTFHSLTELSPFLGALCVLAVLWIVNEIFNHKLLRAGFLTRSSLPVVLKYGVIQMMLYVMGMMLIIGVVQETGVLAWVTRMMRAYIHNIWVDGLMAGGLSTVLENFATALTTFSLGSTQEAMLADFGTNGLFWKLTAYATAVGGNILCFGSMSGLALMKMERLHIGWFFRHVGWMALVGALLGMVFFMLIK